MTPLTPERQAARLRLVEEHVGHENRHDLDGIMATFGAAARYDDEPWNEHHAGHDGVRAFYADLLRAMPDLRIDVQRRHAGDAAIVLEVIISGHHLAAWRGLPATGSAVVFPLCAIFTFDDDDRMAGEKVYYDRASILRQLGVFHEPEGLAGRINAALMHPMTMLSVIGRMIGLR